MNIVDQIFAQARPRAIALLGNDFAISFAALEAQVTATAQRLQEELGLVDGSERLRIGLACPNGPDHVILALAVLRADACLVPIPSELAIRERQALVDETALHAVIASDRMPWKGGAENSISIKQASRRTGFQPVHATFHTGVRSPKASPAGFTEQQFAALNPALIRFSSGTTGSCKGVILSHETLLERVTAANDGLQITAADRVVWILPMAHHFAVSIVLYLLNGATTVLVDSHLGAEILEAARTHAGTILYASPFHYKLLVDEPSGQGIDTLRLAVSTAAALPKATAHAFRERFGNPLHQGLGIIEVGLSVLNTSPSGEPATSIGKPLAAYRMELRSEDGRAVATGELGEVHLQGPGMVDAYLSPWTPRTEILRDGWFCSGDLAIQDAEGNVFLKGRRQGVINVAGMKCFPEEIEAALNQHPAVRESYAKAQAHPTMGAVPVADIVLADPDNPPKPIVLSKHCREHLSNYKVPMKFTFVEALEKTASGKIKRC